MYFERHIIKRFELFMNDVHNIVREEGAKIKRGKQKYRFVVINKIGNINNKERDGQQYFSNHER